MEIALSPFKPFSPAGQGPGLRAAATRRGDRLYVIGDVHGRYDLLLDLIFRIEAHAHSLPAGPSPKIVLLGDLIDRGGGSRQVLKFAYDVQRENADLIVLMGNHEAMMVDAAQGRVGAMKVWMRLGGEVTLRSFGIEPPAGDYGSKEYALALQSAVPAAWLQWMRQLPLTLQSGDYLFCHAGIRPGVSLKRQSRQDLLWIREEFLCDAGDHGAVIVHGHSISRTVEVRHNRIGIDTGAYRSGVLTALYLEGEERAIISTAKAEPDVLPRTLINAVQ